jgi:hypothetical protein
MTRTMFDAINLNAMPTVGASAVAFYLNGDYAVPSIAAVSARFPTTVFAQNPIDVLGDRADYALTADVETGDLKAPMTEQWITDWRAKNPAFKLGEIPTLYCNRNTIPAVRVGTGEYLLGRDYDLWVATGDGTVYTGADLTGPYANGAVVACQDHWYRLYDSSIIFSRKWLLAT